jgi:ABC-type transport system involved in multi-copper enzyme maturation permease subunit
MVRHILWQTLRRRRALLAFMGLGMLAIETLIAWSYQPFGGAELQMMMQALPEVFRKLLKLSGAGAPFTVEGYLALGYFHPIFLVLTAALPIIFAANSIAGEVRSGTILLILGRPVPRWRYLLAHVSGLMLAAVPLLAVALLGSWLGLRLSGYRGEAELGRFLWVLLNAYALLVAIGGYAFLFSALSSDPGRAASWAVGLTLGSFFLDYLASLWSRVERLGPLSLYHYYDPSAILERGGVLLGDFLLLFGVFAVGLGAAFWAFHRRDLRV